MTAPTLPASRRQTWHALVCFAVVFVIYAGTASRFVGLEDDGIFLLTAYSNGVSHPPGYPLFNLLGWLASQLPLSTVAYRVHLLSAVCGALTCAFLWLIAYFYWQRIIPAYLAGIGYGLSATFWSQAIVAEVYSLNALLFFALYYLLAIAAERAPQRLSRPIALASGLLAGLGLSLHWPLFLLAALGLLPLLIRLRAPLFFRSPIVLIGMAVGLLPYAWMVYRSHAPAALTFYGPISSWEEFWFYVSRQGYAAIDNSPMASLGDQIQFALFALRRIVDEFAPVAIPFILLGVVYVFRAGHRERAFSMALGFAGPALVLPFLLHFDFDFFHQALFRVYPLTAYGFAALWLAAGSVALTAYLNQRFPTALAHLPLARLVPIVVLCTICINNAPARLGYADTQASSYARLVLEKLPADAVLWLDSDMTTGPIAYTHGVDNVRPDISLYNANGFLLPTRLFRPFRQNRESEKIMVARFMRQTPRPIAYIDPLPHGYGAGNLGLFKLIEKEAPPARERPVLDRDILRFFHRVLLSPRSSDPWLDMHQQWLIGMYGSLLAQLWSSTGDRVPERWILDELELVTLKLYGALAVLKVIIVAGNPDWEYIDQVLSRAHAALPTAHFKHTLAEVYYLTGLAAAKRGGLKQAHDWFCKAWQAWPSGENLAKQHLNGECGVSIASIGN